MRTTGMVVVVVVGGFSCFSTARYDDAHTQRVASINARYEAERQRADDQYTSLVIALDRVRASLVPIKPGCQCDDPTVADSFAHANEPAKTRCVHDVCQPAYVDALTETYFDADVTWVASQLASKDAEIEALLASSHNREVLRYIDEQTRTIEQQRAQAHRRLASERQGEIRASEQQRSSEIAAGRAMRRARLQAAANAFTAMERGPLGARQPCIATTVDLLSRAGEYCTGVWPGGAPASDRSPPPPVDRSPARR